MLGANSMLGVLALTAFAPVSIHMGQHALIDGFFAFWATMCVWMLWENFHHPNDARWLASFCACLALMVLTKENSFFVFVALCGLIVANRWAKFGTVTPALVAVGICGPLLGTLSLVWLAGGVGHFVEIYRVLVTKAQTLTYAIRTGDGPWHRYLVDMLIVSPLVLILAIGGFFTQLRRDRAYLFLALFVGFTYVLMCNVKYAMNLRYATIWDLPLCALATAQIGELTKSFGRRQPLAAAIIVTALCAYGLRQYLVFFADFGLYELVSEGLLRAVKILK
jgi:4-amino-4-deoxy-L-arabinose transferase-like glycosyltransferase